MSRYPSLSTALAKAYPDISWDRSKFAKAPRPSFQMPSADWANLKIQQHFFKRIGSELGIQQVRFYLSLPPPTHSPPVHIRLLLFLSFFLPPSLTSLNPLHYIKKMSDWYTVSRKDIYELGGRGLFEQYQSLEEALRTVYPTYPWDSGEFLRWRRLHKSHWSDPAEQRTFLEDVASKLGVTQVVIFRLPASFFCSFPLPIFFSFPLSPLLPSLSLPPSPSLLSSRLLCNLLLTCDSGKTGTEFLELTFFDMEATVSSCITALYQMPSRRFTPSTLGIH